MIQSSVWAALLAVVFLCTACVSDLDLWVCPDSVDTFVKP